MALNLINSFLINQALIISTISGLYFAAMRLSLDNTWENKINFNPKSYRLLLSKKSKIWLGLGIGLLCILISFNSIPFEGLNRIDVRYLPIFFSVIYGSPLIGTVAAFVVVTFKTIEYILLGASISLYLNNILFTLFILWISYILYKKDLPIKITSQLFLGYVLLARFLIFSFIFYPVWTMSLSVNMAMYLVVFSSIFLITSWSIYAVIEFFKKLTLYKTSATYDKLTNFYNKEAFMILFEHSFNSLIEQNRTFSLAIIDIDNFKVVNDTYGHLTGDQLLKKIATVIKSLVNHQDIQCFRIGGDELALIFNYDTPSAFLSPSDYCRKIVKELEGTPLIIDNVIIPITLSIGIVTTYHTETEEITTYQADDIFKLADKQLYLAKNKGKNTVEHTIVKI